MSRTTLTEKFWKIIEDALDDPDRSYTYYIGGSLCVDLPTGGVALNLDGTGFSFKGGLLYILEKVRIVYVDTKGETDYYKSEKIKWEIKGSSTPSE